jgi:hypothetical protein
MPERVHDASASLSARPPVQARNPRSLAYPPVLTMSQMAEVVEGDDPVSAHMAWHVKLRSIERDPRVVLSFDAPRKPGVVMNPYAVLRARATVQPSDETWDLLNRLAKVYISPDAGYPPPKRPGYIVRYSVERIGGVGPWAPKPTPS